MLKLELSPLFALKSTRGRAASLFLLALMIGAVTTAGAQDFSLQMGAFTPFAMNPGGSATSNITLNPLNGFSGSVDLTCTVTSPANATPPACTISPASVTPPGTATATVSSLTASGGTATPGPYTITITGTSGALSHQSSQDVSVLSVTAQFTITIANIVSPGSVPAGNAAQAKISVNPISGYSGIVTLSCSSISPVVLVPPICTFNYPSGATGLTVNGTPTTVTLTINTTGPIPNPSQNSVGQKGSWALWLPFPAIGLVFLRKPASGKRLKMWLTFLALVAVAWTFVFLPACASTNVGSTTTTTNPNGNTPANSYSFTLTGVDQNGNISSNTGTNNSAASVSLTVTAPAQ